MFFQHKNKWKLVPDHWETGICSTEWRCRSHTESRSSDQSESHERDTTRVIKHLTEAALLHDVTTQPMIINRQLGLIYKYIIEVFPEREH